MSVSSLLAELKRRKVLRVAGVYAIVAWILLQVVATTAPLLRLPEWTPTLVLVLLLVGFPLALIIAWAFELTPGGVRRTDAPAAPDDRGATSQADGSRRAAAYVGLGMLVALTGFGAYAYLGPQPEPPAPGSTQADAETAAERSIAVLPFDNLSGLEENEYFSDGITEDILTRLARVPDLRVISRTSVMAYKGSSKSLPDIARELGVTYILEGSVRRAGDQVRVTGQLIRAATDDHLWAESYDRELDDIFAVQSEIATEITEALELELSPEERSRLAHQGTESTVAYELYLKGRAYNSRPYSSRAEMESHQASAATLFRAALEEDPDFAPAWSELARATLYSDASSQAQHDSAVAYARRAIELDPELADGYVRLANLTSGRDEEKAIELARRALEINPSHAGALSLFAWIHESHGRLDEAIRFYRQAARVDPHDFGPRVGLAHAYETLGLYGAAERWYRKAFTEAQENPAMLACELAELRLEQGDREEARRHAQRILEITPAAAWPVGCVGDIYLDLGDMDEAAKHYQRAIELEPDGAWYTLITLGYIARETGDRERADSLLAQAERQIPEHFEDDRFLAHLARFAAVRGERETAIELFGDAVAGGWLGRVDLDKTRLFDTVADDPRFRRLVERVNADLARMRERVVREGWL